MVYSPRNIQLYESLIVNCLLPEEAQGGAGDPAAPAATDTLAPEEAPAPAETPAAADTTPVAPQPGANIQAHDTPGFDG